MKKMGKMLCLHPTVLASATENPYEPITSGAEITSHQIPLDIKTALRNYEKL